MLNKNASKMQCTAIKSINGSFSIESRKFESELFTEPDLVWIDIIIPNRSDFIAELEQSNVDDDLLRRLANPGKTFRLERIKDTALLDCNINYGNEDINNAYVTLVFANQFLITISGNDHRLTDSLQPDNLIKYVRKHNYQFIVLALLGRMVDYNVGIAREVTKRVDEALKVSIGDNFIWNASDSELLYHKVIDLTEIFEDQLTTIRLLPIDEGDTGSIGKNLSRIEKSMDHLVSIMERSVDKLDYIFQRNRSLLQEKGNTKLNTLTIIQSIFVPLTFIAGIYGMNFVNMPELEWTNGYFLSLSLMGIIAFGSLYLFYKNGWFK